MHLAADHAGIGGNGAAIVTWETYTAVCSDGFCELSNYIPHASRQDAGTGDWVDSGTLLGPAADSHNALVALDSTGRAMLVSLNGSGAYVSATQGASGGGWSPFNLVVDTQSISIVSDLASDNAGDVTMVYEAIGFSVAEAVAVSGSMSTNAWSPPVVLSVGDWSVSEVYFALAPSGEALAVWATNNATATIQAVTRATPSATWTSPVVVSQPGNSEIEPEAAAIGDALESGGAFAGHEVEVGMLSERGRRGDPAWEPARVVARNQGTPSERWCSTKHQADTRVFFSLSSLLRVLRLCRREVLVQPAPIGIFQVAEFESFT